MEKYVKNIILFLSYTALFNFGILSQAEAAKVCFDVQGMTCATCPITVKVAIKKLSGINEVNVSFKDKSAVDDYDEKKAIDAVGYKTSYQECNKWKGKE